MPRTTVDIDASVLAELKRRLRRQDKTLGALMSELLARALAEEEGEPAPFAWSTARMTALVDLEDKDRVQELLDER